MAELDVGTEHLRRLGPIKSLIHEDQQQSELGTDSNGLPTLKYGDIRSNLDSSHNDDPHAKVPGHDGSIDINSLQHSNGVWDSLACLIGAETGGLFKIKTANS
ncbi:hypothetical protein Pst134EB_020619 [Puccinia striiformis f. sp. tritici]|nr:hypothetical protein Pst134EB_020619 [Puccinia striiformis f. sp. tritici]